MRISKSIHVRRNPTVALVIITKDRPDELRDCLTSALHQTVSFHRIIIVDSSSTPDTKKYIQSIQSSIPITYLFEQKKGYAVARNRGFAAVKTAWVASTDDDCVLAQTWVAHMIRAIQHYPKTQVFIGQSQTAYPKNIYSLVSQYYELLWKKPSIQHNRVIDPEIFDTKNICFKTAIFKKNHLHFRQEKMKTMLLSTDDIDMGMQLYTHNIDGIYIPHAIVYHKDPQTFRRLIKKIRFDRISYRFYEKRWHHIRIQLNKKHLLFSPYDIFFDIHAIYQCSYVRLCIVWCMVKITNNVIKLSTPPSV